MKYLAELLLEATGRCHSMWLTTLVVGQRMKGDTGATHPTDTAARRSKHFFVSRAKLLSLVSWFLQLFVYST